jgi:hypothetical protein
MLEARAVRAFDLRERKAVGPGKEDVHAQSIGVLRERRSTGQALAIASGSCSIDPASSL